MGINANVYLVFIYVFFKCTATSYKRSFCKLHVKHSLLLATQLLQLCLIFFYKCTAGVLFSFRQYEFLS